MHVAVYDMIELSYLIDTLDSTEVYLCNTEICHNTDSISRIHT